VKIDDPNITMEEYIRLEEEKARRHAILFNDTLTSEEALSCEPTVSSLNNDEIDFRISFDESDDEDCTEQNVLHFNDLFPFNIIYPDDSKSDKDNDDDKIDIEHSSGDLSVKPLPDDLMERRIDDVGDEFTNLEILKCWSLETSRRLCPVGVVLLVKDCRMINLIMEYLVNISKRRAFWSLNKDILKMNDSDNQYAVSIKEDTAYPCMHSPKPQRKEDQYAVSRRSQYAVLKI
ncbi:hypothetical protein Tco_0906192, partial [Tanacetum coccineum]